MSAKKREGGDRERQRETERDRERFLTPRDGMREGGYQPGWVKRSSQMSPMF